MNTEDISAHRTYIPADYMLSPNSALEGAAFESKGMKNSVILPYALPPLC